MQSFHSMLFNYPVCIIVLLLHMETILRFLHTIIEVIHQLQHRLSFDLSKMKLEILGDFHKITLFKASKEWLFLKWTKTLRVKYLLVGHQVILIISILIYLIKFQIVFKECASFVESGKFSNVLFVTRNIIEIGMLACKFNYFYINWLF